MLKNDKKDIRRIITTKGELSILRTVLRPMDAASMDKLQELHDVRCIAPLDIVLKIDDLPFKMTREMMCEVAFWGQNQSSFKSASSIIKKVHGTSISSETVRAITDYVGKIIFDRDTREAEDAYENVQHISYARNKNGVLYIQADGAALNTRTKNAEGSTWRENKLGMVFSSDNIRKTINKKGEMVGKILKKEYTSYVGSAQEFKKRLLACAIKNGYGAYKETVMLSDGATWIKNIGEELFPDAVQILDLFHLCENTYSYAKAIFKNDESKYKPWAEDIIEKLKNGEKQNVVQILKSLKNRKIPKGTVNLYTYITNNIHRIDYKEYKEKGYYVGSGAIESGNKVVLQKRLKLAGMRWDETSAQYLLSLRAKYESELWKTCVVKVLLSYDFKIKNL
jgi:DNA-directed RNA polymerase subunit F